MRASSMKAVRLGLEKSTGDEAAPAFKSEDFTKAASSAAHRAQGGISNDPM
jgi:hypothetical protein